MPRNFRRNSAATGSLYRFRRILIAVAAIAFTPLLPASCSNPPSESQSAGVPAVSESRRQEADKLLQTAREMAEQGKIPLALEMLESARAADPARTETYHARAALMEQSGNMRGALAELMEAHRARPDDARTLDRILTMSHGLIPPAENEELARKALKLTPDSANAHYYLGMAIVASNNPSRYAEALSAFRASHRIEPIAQNQIQVGKILIRLKKDEEAVAALEDAVRMLDIQRGRNPVPLPQLETWLMQRRSAAFWLSQGYRRLGRPADSRKATDFANILSRKTSEIRALQDRVRATPPDRAAGARLNRILQYQGFPPD